MSEFARWSAHPLCAAQSARAGLFAPETAMPARFWGPERCDPEAWRELAAALEPDAEVAAIVAALGDARDVVDVGGGTGLIARAVAARVRVTVIEPDAEQRAHAPANLVVRAGRAEALPLPDASADAALATWVLQYCDDPLAAVGELARVARRRVVVVQAAPGNDLVAIYNLEAAIAGLPPAHHGWLLAHAAARLEAAGFTVTLRRVAIAARGISADALARLHFAASPPALRAAMVAATAPYVAARGGVLADDGVVLSASRSWPASPGSRSSV
jgi:SAM-dependent methyltransferase